MPELFRVGGSDRMTHLASIIPAFPMLMACSILAIGFFFAEGTRK
jgi:hypothetical protein